MASAADGIKEDWPLLDSSLRYLTLKSTEVIPTNAMRLFILIAFLAATASATPTVKKLDGEAMTFPSGLLYKSMTGRNLKRGNPAMAPLFRRGKPEEHLVGRTNFW